MADGTPLMRPPGDDMQAARYLLSDLAAAGYVLAATPGGIEVILRLRGTQTPPPLHPEIADEVQRLERPLRELLGGERKAT